LRSLYVRIWLTVVAALLLFAVVSGWLVQRHLDQERLRNETVVQERVAAWGELLQRSLPGADQSAQEQADGLRDWSQRLNVPMALNDADGVRIAASDSFLRREADLPPQLRRAAAIPFADGRTLWVMRPRLMRPGTPAGAVPDGAPPRPDGALRFNGLDLPGLPEGPFFVILLALLFAAVAAGAWPVVRRLTRRLEALKQGVEAFGAGALHQRVSEDGRDEVAALGASFNRAAGRIETLLNSHRTLLANASHELRSPLARLKMALAMLDDAPVDQHGALQAEIRTNIAELDALVEEVLLASRLDARSGERLEDPVDLLVLAAEEGSRVGADVQGDAITVTGEERLLRRALRNLLENARRYGGDGIDVVVTRHGGTAQVQVLDRGPGIPEDSRERIFEPFFRLPGHAEREGGVGLGLALVRQIAERHGGQAACSPRTGGGSCFTLTLPLPA
jgi:signal transduction histidine kinase